MEERILIGYGCLSWWRHERQSYRYGSVSLFNENSLDQTIGQNAKLNLSEIENLLNQKGKLICEVLETRESTHIGDLTHDFYPKTPNVGDVIVLGEGTLFIENDCVGLKPLDGRQYFWLDPEKLL